MSDEVPQEPEPLDRERRVPRTTIDWSLPPGPHGPIARFIGPGATRGELALQFGAATAAAVALPVFAMASGWGWGWLQLTVAGILALDLVGGVVTNATGSAKRWYHRAGQTRGTHLRFVALHLHPFLVVLVFGTDQWAYAAACYGAVLVSAVSILLTPLHLQRPVALLALIVSVAVVTYGPEAPGHTEWFFPALAVKLLVSHLLREEPYRP